MTCTLLLERTRDATEDTWVDVVSPRTRARIGHQATMDEALDALRAALLHGGSGYVVIDTDEIRPEDEFDRELAELAASHWDD